MTSRLAPTRRSAALVAALVLGLGLTACADAGDDDAGRTSAEAPAATDADGTATADDTDDGSTAGSLSVTSEGRGVLIVRLADDADVDGTEEQLDGKLVSGPGGCLAVKLQGKPELLVFDPDTRFAEEPPRVTLEGSEIKVGQRLSVEATPVRTADLDGLPERCAQGSTDNAWVVDED